MSQYKQKKMPWKRYIGLVLGGLAILMITSIAPIWHWLPVQITEQGTVLAVTEKGCVIKTHTLSDTLPLVQKCNSQPGDVIEVTYYVPSKIVNGYFLRMQEKAALVQP
jgi:hypothetical protein